MTTASAPGLALWTRRQVGTLLAVDVVAVAVILLGAWQCAQAPDDDPALGWFSVSLLGLALSGLAHGSWIARNRRTVRSAVAHLPTDVRLVVTASAPTGRADDVSEIVAVSGSLRYHRRECALATGREVVALSAEDETLAARYACEVCRP
jgi:hypothetical protein